MARRLRVGVIFGGRSGEHDVSLRSAHAIMNALDAERFDLVPIGITRQGRWLTGDDPLPRLAANSNLPLPGVTVDAQAGSLLPESVDDTALDLSDGEWASGVDILFPVLHGPYGEDGTVQGMLELSNIPYVGSGVLASSLAMDKILSKQIFAQKGLPVAPWIWVLRRDWQRDPEAVTARIEAEIGYPCFVKPANLGSSVGISKVRHQGELACAMADAAHYDRKILIEQGLNARELEVSVLGNDDPVTSVVGEIVPSNEFYDYQAKYVDDRSELRIPAPIEPEISEDIRRMAVEAFKAIDGAGMARVDFFLERESGSIYLNEINTIPGFTAISMYPKLWESSGLSFQDLVTRLIELAVERHHEREEPQE